MTQVLVVTDHVPTRRQTGALLAGLAETDVDGAMVTVLMPARSPVTSALMDDMATARGLSYESAARELRASRAQALSDARHHLAHLVASLRAAGYAARGELLPGASTRTLLSEVEARQPTVVLLLNGRHPIAHLLKHDLEARLRELGTARVVVLHGHKPLTRREPAPVLRRSRFAG